jgi:hypothetical protein
LSSYSEWTFAKQKWQQGGKGKNYRDGHVIMPGVTGKLYA